METQLAMKREALRLETENRLAAARLDPGPSPDTEAVRLETETTRLANAELNNESV